MNNSNYWSNRFQQLEKSRHRADADLYKDIEEEIAKAQISIEEKIREWYGRFAINNGISIEEARKQLNSSELKELKWTVQQYIKAGEKNKLTGQFQKELENASAKYHVSRLEAIKLQIKMECESLYGNMSESIDEHLKDQYLDAYYHTAYEIQKGTGVGHSLERINADKLDSIIRKPWAVDEKNFSTRLGENKVTLINNIHTSLTQMCLNGTNVDKAIKDLAKNIQGGKARAGRIIMTESAYFAQDAQKKCFNDLGVEEYEIVATLDSLTCSGTCAGRDGEHYPMKIYQAGVTAPPFHPNCRCCTAPYFPDDDGERIARDEDGKNYYVSSDTTYDEWKKEVVKGDSAAFSAIPNDIDLMGQPKIFITDKMDVKAYEVKAHPGLYTQTFSADAQATINLLDALGIPGLKDVSATVISSGFGGVAAYDHVNNVLFVQEYLDNIKRVGAELSNGYFVAENATDIIKHELYHKMHWDYIRSKVVTTNSLYANINIAKNTIEQDLRKYVASQMQSQPSYLASVVSKNAANTFLRKGSLNEVVAEVLLKIDKGQTFDKRLAELVMECVGQ